MAQRIVFDEDEEGAPPPASERVAADFRAADFCSSCGAGIGEHRRVGEGTCPVCDPVGVQENVERRTVPLEDYPLFRAFPKYGPSKDKATAAEVRRQVELRNHPEDQ